MVAPASGDLRQFAAARAAHWGFDPQVFVRQMHHESGFNPRAVSPAGAIGVAQIMPATARSWGVNPHDPHDALDGAAKAMAGYYRTYRRMGLSHDESIRRSLAAYNAGPHRVAQYGGVPPYRETRNYVAVIYPRR